MPNRRVGLVGSRLGDDDDDEVLLHQDGAYCLDVSLLGEREGRAESAALVCHLPWLNELVYCNL